MEAKPDFTRLVFGPGATPNVTFYGLVPPQCGICIFFNQSNPIYLGSTAGLVRAHPTCPKYFSGLRQITLFAPNAVVATFDVFAFSCCERDSPCAAEGENWVQVSLMVTGILLVMLLRKVIFGLVIVLGAMLCSCLNSRVRQPCARLRVRCGKQVCAKCGTIPLGRLCADCAPPPPFADLGDFIAFYKQRSDNKRAAAGEVDEDKVCHICFATACEWELSCGHKLCLDCLVKSLGANPSCPFDRCAITKPPTLLLAVV